MISRARKDADAFERLSARIARRVIGQEVARAISVFHQPPRGRGDALDTCFAGPPGSQDQLAPIWKEMGVGFPRHSGPVIAKARILRRCHQFENGMSVRDEIHR